MYLCGAIWMDPADKVRLDAHMGMAWRYTKTALSDGRA